NLHETFFNQVNGQANEWRQYSAGGQTQYVESAKRAVVNLFQASYAPPKILSRDAPAAQFIAELRTKLGDVAAAGAYSFLVNRDKDIHTFPRATFFEGLLHGFLYQKNIDWSAKAYQEALNK